MPSKPLNSRKPAPQSAQDLTYFDEESESESDTYSNGNF